MRSNNVVDFWKRVQKTETCWLWQGALDKDGYGEFKLQGEKFRAHRFSYELENGQTSLLVLHSCLNRNCVNPLHLSAGTAKQNTEDRKRDGTYQNGINNPNSKLSEENIKQIRFHFALGSKSSKRLAAEYGIARGYVYQLANRKQ